jgi:type I restriction enzyme R subunit
MWQDLFERLCKQGSPEQKVIIFCVRDWHADRVALVMLCLYTDGCR